MIPGINHFGLTQRRKNKVSLSYRTYLVKTYAFINVLSAEFGQRFKQGIFPKAPAGIYEPARYILGLGGKHVRPVLCLMSHELFDELNEDAYAVAAAVELFHNFTLVHDDIMDEAPLRRGQPAVHKKYGRDSALLSGDVMLVYAYELLRRINERYLGQMLEVFNQTAIGVCEGQQLDMDYALLPLEKVNMESYMHMIALKTSVLLAGSLKMGGILGGGSESNLEHLYDFGKNLGMAFQIQDDYLDAFGDPEKFGKQAGGDILENKKTFLLLKAWALGSKEQCREIQCLLQNNDTDKVGKMLQIYHDCKVDVWAKEEKKHYVAAAREHLSKVTVLTERKIALETLVDVLLERER